MRYTYYFMLEGGSATTDNHIVSSVSHMLHKERQRRRKFKLVP